MAAKQEPHEADLGDYTDYLILSSSDFTQGWRHNIMRLAPASSSDTTDVRHWTEAKLNRRDMQRVRREEAEIARKAAESARVEEEAAAARERGEPVTAAGSMEIELKPGMPGYMAAQVKKEEEQRDDSKVAPSANAAVGSKAPPRPKRGFGAPKKTRRVFVTEGSAKERRLRFEERHPWVLETEDDKKPPNETRWIGKMDSSTSANAGDGSSYICLILDPHSAGSEAAFKVVPANRWYKFASRPKYHTLTADEADAEFEKMQKASDLDMWFSSRRMNTGAGAASSSTLVDGRLNRGTDSYMAAGTSQTSGGYRERLAQARGTQAEDLPSSRMKTVFGNRRGDDGGLETNGSSSRIGKGSRRREDEDEREEFDFEDDFQDDEEGIGQVGDDALDAEENKLLEERIKKEMREANAFGPAGVEDEGAEEDTQAHLTRTGRRMKRILKKRRRGRGGQDGEENSDEEEEDDDDDDEDLKNPYASADEAETDSDEERRKTSRTQQNHAGRPSTGIPPSMSRDVSGSSGPKYPGAPSAGPSRSTSSGPPGSRAASPAPNIVKRAASPTGSLPGSRQASPTPPPSASKRKADANNSPEEERGTLGAGASTKRRKPGSPSPAPAMTPVAAGDDSALIAREEIIIFIKERSPTTKELLRHFKSAMARDARNRDVILKVTKEVAAIAEGKLVLKSGAV